jgi:uncharacterized membrane protein
MTLGPVQLLIVGFEHPNLQGEIRAVLDDLRANDTIRVIDAVVIVKDDDGNVDIFQQRDLLVDEAGGGYVGALIGLSEGNDDAGLDPSLDAIDDENVWYAADAIPNGSAAAAALIEHRWAIPLRGAILRAGGVLLADAWVHPTDMAAVGLQDADVA